MFILIIFFAHVLMLSFLAVTKWIDRMDKKAQQEHESNVRFLSAINKLDSID